MSTPVRIPADVDRPDRVLANLTARQVAILAVTAVVLYAGWTATRAVIPPPVFLVLAIPFAACAAVLALGERDGITLDRLALAVIRHHLAPRHRVAAPEGVRPAPEWLITRASVTTGAARDAACGGSPAALYLPATGVHASAGTGVGVVDLGPDGLAVVAVVSTVNFALRTPTEQEALVATFGRYLHSLTTPVQVLVRTERLDLSTQITELRRHAGGLPHPALETAALDHADYLAQLADHADLLRRQVLLILREPWRAAASATGRDSEFATRVSFSARRRPGRERDRADAATRRAAESRLVRRLTEATDLLAPAGIMVIPLDAGQATAVLAAACSPGTPLPPSAGLAGSDEVITSPRGQGPDPYYPGDPNTMDGLGDTGEDPADDWGDDTGEVGQRGWTP